MTPAASVDDEQLARIEAAPAEARFPSPEQTAEPGVRRIARRRIEIAKPRPRPRSDATAEQRARASRRRRTGGPKVPTILQMEAVECGAAALAMIMASHGRWIPLEELRVQCGVSRDGSKASNLVKGARQLGMVAKGFKHDQVEDLYQLEYPVILFWNFNHFVVLEGFEGGKAWINDPAQGPRAVHARRARRRVLRDRAHLRARARLQAGGHRPSMVTALAAPARRLRVRAHVPRHLRPVPGGAGPGGPDLHPMFIDEILVAGRGSLLRPLLLGMGITALFMMALTRYQEYYLLRLETKLALTTSARFFHHVLRLPVTYFAQRYAGEIGSRVMINDKVAQLLSGRLATTILDCVLVVFYATLMFFYDVDHDRGGIGLSLLNIVAIQLVSKRRTDASRLLLQEHGKLIGTAMNGLQQHRDPEVERRRERVLRALGGLPGQVVEQQNAPIPGRDGHDVLARLLKHDGRRNRLDTGLREPVRHRERLRVERDDGVRVAAGRDVTWANRHDGCAVRCKGDRADGIAAVGLPRDNGLRVARRVIAQMPLAAPPHPWLVAV